MIYLSPILATREERDSNASNLREMKDRVRTLLTKRKLRFGVPARK